MLEYVNCGTGWICQHVLHPEDAGHKTMEPIILRMGVGKIPTIGEVHHNYVFFTTHTTRSDDQMRMQHTEKSK